jgi:hypothetical protein
MSLVKRNVKLILKVLSDLEPLRGSSNKKTLYSTRSRFIRVLKWPTRAKKGPIYTQTRQINYFRNNCVFFFGKTRRNEPYFLSHLQNICKNESCQCQKR